MAAQLNTRSPGPRDDPSTSRNLQVNVVAPVTYTDPTITDVPESSPVNNTTDGVVPRPCVTVTKLETGDEENVTAARPKLILRSPAVTSFSSEFLAGAPTML